MKQVIDNLQRKIEDLEQNIKVTALDITAAKVQIERDEAQNALRKSVIEEARAAIKILKAQ